MSWATLPAGIQHDHLQEQELPGLLLAQDVQEPLQPLGIGDLSLVLVLARPGKVAGSEAVGYLEEDGDTRRGNVHALRAAREIEDDPFRAVAVDHAARPEREVPALRSADEDEMVAVVDHDVLELGGGPVTLRFVEGIKDLLHRLRLKELLEAPPGATHHVLESHPGEAILVDLVQMEDELRVRGTVLVDGEGQGRGVEVLLLLPEVSSTSAARTPLAKSLEAILDLYSTN